MAGKILGLHLDQARINGVLLLARLRNLEVLDCFTLETDHQGPLGSLHSIGERLKERPDAVYVSIGSREFSFRSLQMPFKDTRTISKALRFEVESTLPYSLDERVLDFCISPDGQASYVLSASIPKERLSAYLDSLSSQGLDPEVVEIDMAPLLTLLSRKREIKDFVAVYVGEYGSSLGLVEKGGIRLIRSIRGLRGPDQEAMEALSADVRLAISGYSAAYSPGFEPKKVLIFGDLRDDQGSIGLMEQALAIPTETVRLEQDISMPHFDVLKGSGWDPSIALATALLGVDNRPAFNMRKEAFAKKKRLEPFIRQLSLSLWILGFLILLLCARELYSVHTLERRYHELDSNLREIYSQTFKEAKRGEDPVVAAKNQVNELKKKFKDFELKTSGVKSIDVLKDVIVMIPQGIQLELNRLVLDIDSIQISGTTDSYNSIDLFKNELQKAKLVQDVNIQSAKVDKTGKIVNFEIRLKRKG